MTKPSNAKTVTATMSCDKKQFKCTIDMDNGAELYFNGVHGIDVFFNMLDVFYWENDGEDEMETVH